MHVYVCISVYRQYSECAALHPHPWLASLITPGQDIKPGVDTKTFVTVYAYRIESLSWLCMPAQFKAGIAFVWSRIRGLNGQGRSQS